MNSLTKPDQKSGSFLKKTLLLVLKYGIGVLALFLLIRSGSLDLNFLKKTLLNSPWHFAIALFIYIFGVNGFAVLRWFLLLRLVNAQVTFFTVFRLHFIGLFFSAWLPGGTAGDVVKAYYLYRGRSKEEAKRCIASMVMDRVIGLLGLLSLSVLGIVFHASWLRHHPSLHPILLGVALAGSGALLVFALLLWPDAKWLKPLFHFLKRSKIGAFVSEVADAMTLFRSLGKGLLLAVLITIITHSLLISVYVIWSHALGSQLATHFHFLVVPICTFTNGLPFTPAGVGVGQVAAEWLYAQVGEPHGSEILALVHVVVFLVGFAASGFYFGVRRVK